MICLLPMMATPQRALNLSGGEGLRVPYTAALAPSGGELTLEAWIKPRSSFKDGSYHFIVSKNYGGTGYALLLIGNGDDCRVQFEANDTIAYGVPMRVLQRDWWHVAGVFRGGRNMELYLNGVKVAEKPTDLFMMPNSLPLHIGTSQWESFVGEIDEVRIWSVARTQEEIVASARARLKGKEPGLMAAWDFERIVKRRAYDRTHRTRPAELIGKPEHIRTIR